VFYLARWVEGWVGMFMFMGVVGFGITLIVASLVGLLRLVFKKDRTLILPLVTACLSYFVVVYQPIERITEKLKSPVSLYGYCDHAVTAASLKLRENGSFEYNAGAFLSREIYYGSYKVNADTVILNFEDPVPNNVNNMLLFSDEALIEIGDSTMHKHRFLTSVNNVKE